MLQLMGISEEEARRGAGGLRSLGRVASCTAAVQTDPEPEDELESRWVPPRLAGAGPHGPHACSRGFVGRLSALERDGAGSAGGAGSAARGAGGGGALAARLCKELSALFFVRCDYSLAHAWAARALRLLRAHHPPALTVDVLRACAKVRLAASAGSPPSIRV